MLQNRTSIEPAYFDEIIDLIYGHTLVDAVPSMARRSAAVVNTITPTLIYALPESWRALDSDYAYLSDQTRIPIFTSQEQWLMRQPPASTTALPSRMLHYADDAGLWYAEFDAVPLAASVINVPGTFYRGPMPAEGPPNSNEGLAVMYGTVLHIAQMQSLSDIARDAQSGFLTQLGTLKSKYASERNTPSAIPPARDF